MSSDHAPQIRTQLEPLGHEGHLARVTVDNPIRLNVLNSELIRQLTAAIRGLGGDAKLRCVVLTGAGERAFIGGADIREMVELDTTTADASSPGSTWRARRSASCPCLSLHESVGIVSVVGSRSPPRAIYGWQARTRPYGMPEVRVGIPSVIEAALLPRLVGAGKTRELVYTGESITATEAARCGLVDRVVPGTGLDDATHGWVQAIGAAGAQAIRLQKALLRRWDAVSLDDAIQAGIQSFTSAYQTDEPRRLMQAFLKRQRRYR